MLLLYLSLMDEENGFSLLMCFQGLLYAENDTLFESTGLYGKVRLPCISSLLPRLCFSFYPLPLSFSFNFVSILSCYLPLENESGMKCFCQLIDGYVSCVFNF